MIEVKNLTVKYGATKSSPEVLALKNISLKMEHGHFNVILGVSGSGKTTLLRTIAGLMKYEGQIIVDGHDYSSIPTSDRNLAMVAQNYNLYPHLTVFDNIAFPLKVRGAPRKEIIDSVYELAELFEIKFLLNRKVKELSGGQQQRVALLRAIIKKPELYLFDEPLSNVSLEKRDEEKNFIKEAVRKYNSTAIYVTHNIKEATSLADKIFILDNGELIFEGTPKEALLSTNIKVRSLMEASK